MSEQQLPELIMPLKLPSMTVRINKMSRKKIEIVTKGIEVDPDLVQGKVVIEIGIDPERRRKGLDLEIDLEIGENLDLDLGTETRRVIRETNTAETDPDPKTDMVTGTKEMTDIETGTMLMNCASSRRILLDTRSTEEDLEVVLVKT